jgi:hypothetical protein
MMGWNLHQIMVYSLLTVLIVTDCELNHRSIKRPDASFHLHFNSIPQPPPVWLKFMSNDAPYPNIVVEVAVNHESPTKLINDCQRYFSASTSVRLWIGVKYWAAEKKFWVGYAVRCPAGVGGTVTTEFQFPPDHHDINIPTNVVYSIPMAMVFGPGITFPPGIAANADLQIDTDIIRRKIINNI